MLSSRVPGDYAFGSEPGVLSQPRPDDQITKKVGYWLIKVLDRNEATKQAHVAVILLGSEAEAKQVRERLTNGEDFGTVAGEVSQLGTPKESGGDLGYVSQGMVSPAFNSFQPMPSLRITGA
jgi:non-canonical (house-cleaning) NTP pyrophosphatase